jgi:hypothetical protein
MTVKELKEQLNQYSDDMEVYVQVYYNMFYMYNGKLNNFKTKDNKLCLEYMRPSAKKNEEQKLYNKFEKECEK